jgi:rod shape determining protein RodA
MITHSLVSEISAVPGKLARLHWPIAITLSLIAAVGFVTLYSAAGGQVEPWAARQMVRFAAGFLIMLAVACTPLHFWMRIAYAVYGMALALLVAVEIAGEIGMGAQRWLDLGVLQIQPSEIMKVAIILTLARYFHGLTYEQVGKPIYLITPLALVLAPAALVLKQPDLGTAAMLIAVSGAVLLLAGVRLWKFALAVAAGGAVLPIAWGFLHDYQKRRVWTFLDPESDPLGAGYHIMQSKIALGSGGPFGRGFLNGTQSHLNFLPEKQTDFIFTTLAEEQGLVGAVALLALYVLVVVMGYTIAMRCRNQFGRLIAAGVITMFFLYMFINMAMVMGLVPVVGVPLPLVSYGGTAMLSLMFAFGLVLCADLNRDVEIARRWYYGEN